MEEELQKRVSRRTFVKGATAVTGAAVASAYVKPELRGLGVASALAVSPGPPPPTDPPPTDPPPSEPPGDPTGKVPSHAIFLVVCDGVRYGVKLDGTSFDKIASPSDTSFMSDQSGLTWSDPTDAIKAMFAGHGGPGTDPDNELALVLTIPAGCSLVNGYAYVFDGGLQQCGNNDKYQEAAIVGTKVYFYGACKED